MPTSATRTPFKAQFSHAMVHKLGARLRSVAPGIDTARFVATASDGLEALAMKARARHIAHAMRGVLPKSFPEAAAILVAALPDEAPGGWADFSVWPMTMVVEDFGLDDFEVSMEALGEMTKRFSSEFAVRPFFARYPTRMLEQMQKWAQADNWHLRRLASEGCRPRLPWGSRLPDFQRDPTPVLEILERLVDDREPAVRRSVANNLNDISKEHPDRAAEVAARWMQLGGPRPQWVARHGLRTLVKAGHRGALEALGYTVDPQIALVEFVCPRQVVLGGTLDLSVTLRSTGPDPQRLVIDYAVHHLRGNGTHTPKVFKLATRVLEAGETLTLSKRHAFAPITTRRYYPGIQTVEILVAGRVLVSREFNLLG